MKDLLITVCMYCGDTIKTTIVYQKPSGVSHGLCKECEVFTDMTLSDDAAIAARGKKILAFIRWAADTRKRGPLLKVVAIVDKGID